MSAVTAEKAKEIAREKGKEAARAAFKAGRAFKENLLSQAYPWRKGQSPFQIFLAELLLRKTTAARAAGVFAELLGRYPEPCALSGADAAQLEALPTCL